MLDCEIFLANNLSYECVRSTRENEVMLFAKKRFQFVQLLRDWFVVTRCQLRRLNKHSVKTAFCNQNLFWWTFDAEFSYEILNKVCRMISMNFLQGKIHTCSEKRLELMIFFIAFIVISVAFLFSRTKMSCVNLCNVGLRLIFIWTDRNSTVTVMFWNRNSCTLMCFIIILSFC